MSLCIRCCVECPKCQTRYLIAASPYANGSYILRPGQSTSEEIMLYCSCSGPPAISRWTFRNLRKYSVSKPAHHRGYGSPQEIVLRDLIAGGTSSA